MKYIGIVLFIVLLVAAYMMFKNLQQPQDIGLHNGQLAPLNDKPNGVSSQTDNPSKKVNSLPWKGNLEVTQQALLTSLKALGEYHLVTVSENYIHAVMISPSMRYRDDLELLIVAESGQVEYRSQSRIGHSDLGLNQQRYQVFADYYLADSK